MSQPQSRIASLRKTLMLGAALVLLSVVSGGAGHGAVEIRVEFLVVLDSHFLHFSHVVEDLSALTDLADHIFSILFLLIDASFEL